MGDKIKRLPEEYNRYFNDQRIYTITAIDSSWIRLKEINGIWDSERFILNRKFSLLEQEIEELNTMGYR